MKDTRLWELLAEGRHSEMSSETSELKALLAQLAQLELRMRMPFLSRLHALPKEHDVELRQLQMRVFAGASGWQSWNIMLQFTGDAEIEVRRAATNALLESANASPWLLCHLLFHPEMEIRQWTIDYFHDRRQAVPGILLHLLADGPRGDLVRQAVEQWGFADQVSGLLMVALQRNNLLSVEVARKLFSTMSAPELATCLERLPQFSPQEMEAIYADRSRLLAAPLRPRGADYDGLSWILELFWESGHPDAAERTAATRFFEHLNGALTQTYDEPWRQLVASAVATARRLGSWSPRVAAHCLIVDPRFLLRDDVPRKVRRAACRILYDSSGVVPEQDEYTLVEVLKSRICRRPSGQLDLWVIGAVMHYRRTDGCKLLLDHFSKNQIVSGFLADPEDSVSFFRYTGSLTHRRDLIEAIRAKRGPLSLFLDAMLVHVVPSNALQFLDPLTGKQCLSLLNQMLTLASESGFELTERKTTLVASIVCDRLSPHQVHEFLSSWLESDVPRNFSVGLEILALAARHQLSADDFAAFALGLEVRRLHKLLECMAYCAGLPYSCEVTTAMALAGHSDDHARQWALDRVPASSVPVPPTTGKTKPAEAKPTAETQFPVLTPAMAARIESCSEVELPEAVEHCLDETVRGLCRALAVRPLPVDSQIEVAAALVVSADPVEEMDRQFVRFANPKAGFLNRLTALVVTRCQGRKGLPVVANAWLSPWEEHAFAFAETAMDDRSRLMGLLELGSRLNSPIVANQLWFAVRRVLSLWRFRFPARFADFVDADLLRRVAAELSDRNAELAARILISARDSRLVPDALAEVQPDVLELLPDCAPEVRRILQPWVDSRGYSGPRVVGRRTARRLESDLLVQINQTTDLDELIAWCRHHDGPTVTNAALRCVELGGRWLEALIDLLGTDSSVVHPGLLAETASLWPSDSLMALERLVVDERLDALTRFILGVNLLELGRPEFFEVVLATTCEPASPSWLQREDVARLKKYVPSDRSLALRLVVSPHPHAYMFAVNELLGRKPGETEILTPRKLDTQVATALRAFLDCGSDRLRSLRLDAAMWLFRCRDLHGYPLLLEAAAECDSHDTQGSELTSFPAELVDESVESALLAGHLVFPEDKVLELLEARTDHQAAAIALNAAAVSNKVRQALARHLRQGLMRSGKLRDVAEVFAWGVPIARQLTEQLFSIELIGGDDFGYTRLHENKIFINPLAILQRKPQGRKVVEGLILHELGHHMYHRGREEQEIWDKANQEGMGSLLNLVADEHLERNIRALDRGYGDRLKTLAAHAFQHTSKEVHYQTLLDTLGLRAFEILSRSRLQVARRQACIRLPTRRVMREMERNGLSFSRFFRALRLGLGNRHQDPRVAEALKLFGSDFRHHSMQRLYDICVKLREIFGSECEILKCFGQDRIVEGEGSQVMIDGEGMSNSDIQAEVRRIENPEEVKSSSGGGARWINVSEKLDFEPITWIEPVHSTMEKHAEYAASVRRYARQLRKYLSQLGLRMISQRRRIRGGGLDRASLSSAMLRNDPRILKQREPRFNTDLFIGIVIDCSGSMEYDDNIEKAKLFGALIAEAVRGMPAIDLRVFGFTDSVIYDAGGAERPMLSGLVAGGGNNDAAALFHAAQEARLSRRRAKLLVMISDGLPTECSVASLRALVTLLTRKWKMCCAQVAVEPLSEICFPDFVLLETSDLSTAVREFGLTIARLIRKSMNAT